MATPTYLMKPTAATGGDAQVPTLNLQGFNIVDRKKYRSLRQHSPAGSAANSYNENTIVTDKAIPVEYWVEFTYFGTSDTLAWKFPTSALRTTGIGYINGELGIDVNS